MDPRDLKIEKFLYFILIPCYHFLVIFVDLIFFTDLFYSCALVGDYEVVVHSIFVLCGKT